MQVKLKEVRIAFINALWTPEQYQNQGPFRYGATFLVVPDSENDKVIEAAIQQVAAEKFGKKAASMLAGIRGNSNKCCYMPGETKDYDGFQGMKYLTSHRKQSDGPVLVIDRNKTPLSEGSGKPYAGCYVNASLDIYAQDGQNSGIRCGLVGVQFVRDGDAFGGASRSDGSEFEDLGVSETAEEEEFA